MSYDIIRSIEIDEKEGKVWIEGASSNVFPKTYERWDSTAFSKILKEKGKEEAEAHILIEFENGCFKSSSGKYVEKLKVLRYDFAEEYEKYDWRKDTGRYGSPEYEAHRKRRDSQEFIELLKRVMRYKPNSKRYVIKQKQNGTTYYGRKNKSTIRWDWIMKGATKFKYKKEAEDYIKLFENTDNWEIAEV